MQPDGPGYRLWLGDVVEFAQAVWGPGSAQLAGIAGVLRGSPAPGDESGAFGYLQRLQRLDDLLAGYERELAAG